MVRCRSCGAVIRWAMTQKKDKRIPLDPEPVEDGNLVFADEEGKTVRAFAPLFDGELPRYVSHFATCPHANEHRRR